MQDLEVIQFKKDRYTPVTYWPTVSEVVKDNRVRFEFYRSGFFYYSVVIPKHHYEFSIPIEDVGNATLPDYDKAITFMRWIRKAIEDKTLQELTILYATQV
jgi:hypothetical protein